MCRQNHVSANHAFTRLEESKAQSQGFEVKTRAEQTVILKSTCLPAHLLRQGFWVSEAGEDARGHVADRSQERTASWGLSSWPHRRHRTPATQGCLCPSPLPT